MFRKSFEKRHSRELKRDTGRNYVGRQRQSGSRVGSSRKKFAGIDPADDDNPNEVGSPPSPSGRRA